MYVESHRDTKVCRNTEVRTKTVAKRQSDTDTKKKISRQTENDREMNNVETEGQSKKVVGKHINAESYR